MSDPQTPKPSSQDPEPAKTAKPTQKQTNDAPLQRSARNLIDHDYRHLDNPDTHPTTRRVKGLSEAETHIAYVYYSTANEERGLAEKDPWMLEDAQQSHDWEEWDKAIKTELDQLEQLKTWELVNLLERHQAIRNKWVFVWKRNEHGNVVKHKARLVIQSFAQKPSVDYSENGMFAPVIRFDTLRTLLAIATVKDLDIIQLDIKGAYTYLNRKVKEEIYMKQPTGYEDGTGRVCQLLLNLYGLKQAGNIWNGEFDGTMKELGYKRSCTDYCAYIKNLVGDFSIMTTWV